MVMLLYDSLNLIVSGLKLWTVDCYHSSGERKLRVLHWTVLNALVHSLAEKVGWSLTSLFSTNTAISDMILLKNEILTSKTFNGI